MSLLIQRFNYIDLERIDSPNGRLYNTVSGALPSVTTILSKTKDKTHINEWRDKMGHKQADAYVKESTDVGTIMHEMLENYVAGGKVSTGTNYLYKNARNLANSIINNGLINVREVWGQEVNLYYPGLYAGTADLIGIHGNDMAIMDYKNSRKKKKREWIEDYFLQMASYGMAHDELYGTNINKGVIFMAVWDGTYEEYVIEGLEYKKSLENWISRLEMYYNSIA